MKRYAINRLQEWKEDPYRLPMIIRGARQVGKTWLMQEFGRTAFEQCAYINFDRNERMQNLFSGDFDVDRILRGLAIVEIDGATRGLFQQHQGFAQRGFATAGFAHDAHRFAAPHLQINAIHGLHMAHYALEDAGRNGIIRL